MNIIKLVIADDHEIFRKGLRIVLNEIDEVKVIGEAQNGHECLEILKNQEADLILMDIRMPVMDGLTAAQSIRQMRKADAKTIPIIAMTANAFEEDMEKTKAAGMNAHIAKPIEPALLYQTIQRFFVKEE